MNDEKPLSERQEKILEYIWECDKEYGLPPTIREIGTAVNISSTSVVNYNLAKLKERGFLERKKTVSRGLRLTERAMGMFETAVENSVNLLRIPMMGNIRASSPVEVNDNDFAVYDEDDGLEIAASMISGHKNNLFALRVDGDSMIGDMINDGDIVVMQKQESAQDGDMIAAWVDGHGTTLKRIYQEPKKKKVRLQPSNPTMEAIYADPEDVKVQGKVMMVLRQTA